MTARDETYQVRLLSSDLPFPCRESQTLLDAMHEAGVFVDASCAGRSSCGRCAVRLLEGRVRDAGSVDESMALACHAKPCSDLVIEVPSRTMVSPHVQVRTPATAEGPVVAAVDLGTTAIKVELLDGEEGEPWLRASSANPQAAFGSDVLARVEAAGAGKAQLLARAGRRGVADLLEKACRTAGVQPDRIVRVALVGNTAMTSLFLEGDTDRLARAPYRSEFEGGRCIPVASETLGLPGAEAFFLPVLGGFVGSDVTAGLLVAGLRQDGAPRLYVDVGTNGEIVLAAGRLSVASTAAGPALEGGHLTRGMPALPGAVEGAYLDEGGRVVLRTVEDEPARGFCGSGVVEVLAVMLQVGILDTSGLLQPGQPGVVDTPSGRAYTPLPDVPSLCLTQEDIRAVQLALGALRAGSRILLAEQGVVEGQLAEVVLTGAFGARLDAEAARQVGLVPSDVPARIVEDAALRGAAEGVLDARNRARAEELALKAEHVALAEKGFEEVFLACLDFPELPTA